eukprot:CAMPEP_0172301328 /NCGR_PEP_ID=MMETSP1058-20130122/3240_1 /TAXON_ID=83371 /ORGANISM="Detonula confervacea, Strain CCMP 353" /LENGTH=830 /DNA_ID=CAMNT_0013011397 /DNA_START=42 /DNA_END=2534 /DNA_ORIENTATION=-
MSTAEKTANDGAEAAAVVAATTAVEGNVTRTAATDDVVMDDSKKEEVKSDGNDGTTEVNNANGNDAANVASKVEVGDDKPKVDKNDTTTTTTNTNGTERPFDHTSRKVVVHNVLKYIHAKGIAKLTTSWLESHNANPANPKLEITKTKKPPKDNWVKITLADESMVNVFIELINTGGEGGEAMVNGRGKPLFAKRADEMFTKEANDRDDRDGRDGKRGRDDRDNNGGRDDKNKRFKQEITILSNDEVRDKITPLWRMPYEEQLDTKAREMVNKCAKKIVKEIKGKFRILEREAKRGQRKSFPKLYDWVDQKRSIEMEQPVPSPQTYEYRNKCEYTVGYRLIAQEAEKNQVENVVEKKTEGDVVEEGGDETGDVAMKEEDGDVKAEVATDGIKVEETTVGKDAEKTEDGDVKVEGVKVEEVKVEEATTEPTQPTNYKKVPAAGFLAQGWAGGVYPPHTLQNMPSWSCSIADIFNDFLPTSAVPPYDTKAHRGVWRTVTLRCSLRTRECMVIVLHAPAKGGAGALGDGSDDYTNVFEGEKKRLVELLTEGVIPVTKREFPEGHVDNAKLSEESDEGIKVTSIFFQEYEGLSQPAPDHPVQHAYGKKSLEEKLGKCTFQISPGAFFQTNTRGAEVLYNIVLDRIKEVTTNPEQTLLLDVCCGTGTIGLTCLKEGVVGRLVGVDISKPAIEDAKINAEKNGYTEKDDKTTKFIASPAEKVLPDTMKGLPRNVPIVAVVDPARDGLHGVVIRTLRANEKIQRLVYVSCNPTATLVRDAAMLCSPPTKKYPGRPFKPTKAQPVDMFPLTKHCEMVMTFDRMSEEEYEKYHGKEDKS